MDYAPYAMPNLAVHKEMLTLYSLIQTKPLRGDSVRFKGIADMLLVSIVLIATN